MPEPRISVPSDLIIEYSNTVARYGPDSPKAKELRTKYADVSDYVRMADAIDHVKRSIGGRGIDW